VSAVGLNARRLVHILRVLVVQAFAYVVVRYARTWPWLVRRVPLAQLTGPVRFRRLFEDLGGSFIKFGQMLALQPDIVSLEYCDELFNLLDRIAPFPFAHVEQVFLEEFGRPTSALFDEFDPEPIATASIGQVHVAYLGGQKVAVKVQRPTVDAEFAGDIRLMTLTMQLIRRFSITALFWTLEPMGEFVAWTREELDYRREARYADRLRKNAESNPFEKVPAVFWDLTTRRTLVVEFMSGMTVLQYLRAMNTGDEVAVRRLHTAGFEPDRFARHIIDNFLGDAFRFGMFHADLHPANLLIQPGDVVGYVDFGITGVLSHYSRRHLVGMTLAYTRADIDGMLDAFSKLTTSDPDADPQLFRAALAEKSQEWYEGEGSATVFKKNFTLVMLDMLTLSRKTGIWPERDVIKYIRSAIAADGLITRFAPGFNVGRHLEDVCQRWVTWESRRAIWSYDTLAAWAVAGSHLAEDGAARAATILRRIADGDLVARVDLTTAADPGQRRRRRTIRLAGVVVALTALVELTGGAPRFGVNMFTGEAILVGAALVMLAGSIRRLAVAG
jgi:predicted unusual protein kinase regulating ubiquinone biosynthesis (AarF/ABC1/UbiB family)